MAESVASLVERLLKSADEYDRRARNAEPQGILTLRGTCDLLREAASRLSSPADLLREFCQSEGPYGETICMLPLGHEGLCGWEKLGVKR